MALVNLKPKVNATWEGAHRPLRVRVPHRSPSAAVCFPVLLGPKKLAVRRRETLKSRAAFLLSFTAVDSTPGLLHRHIRLRHGFRPLLKEELRAKEPLIKTRTSHAG